MTAEVAPGDVRFMMFEGPLFAVGDRWWDRISPRIFIRACVGAADLH